ncbi:caspase family protein [Variovorax sp. J22R24]|uniref:caspase family protein n=1 Tax=Variovorax gracilis TaxID=3053502 RepID=UPI0025781FD5|nr:caspase family protein [Variovorax sp. J22R24]MDM0108102.1 caspase family protein [Variovorax sp. J22R24]
MPAMPSCDLLLDPAVGVAEGHRPAHGQRLWWMLLSAVLLAFAVATGTAQAQVREPEKRIALVVGNARYPTMPLANPENDARLIADNLRKLGFEVNEQVNLGVIPFRRALRDFARRVQENDSVAVLYYAGHGVQIDGRNYLLPVDINLRDQEEVKDESVDIEELFLSRLDKARSHARIVILDACRDNPFAGKTRNIRSAGGLAEMGARGTLIAYASAPGAPAEDGLAGRNSVYTRNLGEEMMVPGLEVEQMFKNVRVKVLQDTKERQVPWVNTSLTSNFSFNPAQGPSPAQTAAAVQGPSPARGPSPDEAAKDTRLKQLEAELDEARDALEEARTAPREASSSPAPNSRVSPAPAANAGMAPTTNIIVSGQPSARAPRSRAAPAPEMGLPFGAAGGIPGPLPGFGVADSHAMLPQGRTLIRGAAQGPAAAAIGGPNPFNSWAPSNMGGNHGFAGRRGGAIDGGTPLPGLPQD